MLDAGSFHESGLFATSYRPEARERSPADGKIGGFGTVDGRPVRAIQVAAKGLVTSTAPLTPGKSRPASARA